MPETAPHPLLGRSRWSRLGAGLAAELRPGYLLPGLSAGLVVGVINVVIAISFAALIFSGALAQHLQAGIGVALTGAVALALIVAFRSSISSAVAGPQDTVAAITALMAASIAQRVASVGAPPEVLATVVAAIVLTTLATGAFFMALGTARLGRLIRFLPYPVIGGFLAGTGWLLVHGAIGMMADVPLDLDHLPQLLAPEKLARWSSGLGFAILLLVVLRRYQHMLAMPSMIVAGFVVFYGALLLSNTPISIARDQGWLLAVDGTGGLLPGIALLDVSQVHWGVVAAQIGNIGAILILGAAALLLNATAIELQTRQEVDLDRELRAAGLANLVGGAAGGLAGYQALSDTALAQRLGARAYQAGLFTALVCAIALLAGPSLIGYFPMPVLGGLILLLGLYFLVEWVYEAWFRLGRMDYALVLLILLVIATWGFLEGVGFGLLIAIVLFVVNYSNVGVVKHTLSGATYWSNVDRPESHQRVLREKGDQEYILKLQGYLFFGTANSLLEHIRERLLDACRPAVRFVVLDFRQVSGIDSSAAFSFAKLRQLAEAHGFTLALADVPDGIRFQLAAAGYNGDQEETYRTFSNLDYGLEWCEEQILERTHVATDAAIPLEERLAEGLATPDPHVLMAYLERRDVASGDFVVRQGAAMDELFFVEQGSVTVLLEIEGGDQVRLRRMGAGTIIGEVGLYGGGRRTASVVANEPTVLYRLSRAGLQDLAHRYPSVAVAFHQLVVRMLAHRLEQSNRMVEALLE